MIFCIVWDVRGTASTCDGIKGGNVYSGFKYLCFLNTLSPLFLFVTVLKIIMPNMLDMQSSSSDTKLITLFTHNY
jgi:hypothetical protein